MGTGDDNLLPGTLVRVKEGQTLVLWPDRNVTGPTGLKLADLSSHEGATVLTRGEEYTRLLLVLGSNGHDYVLVHVDGKVGWVRRSAVTDKDTSERDTRVDGTTAGRCGAGERSIICRRTWRWAIN